MISENQYKTNLIQTLNQQNSGWIDGDTENGRKNTADVVNHALKIVIEIKDEPKGSPDGLKKANQQYGDHLRSVNKKFNEYPEYKTILLIRGSMNTIPAIVRYSIEGLDTYQPVNGITTYVGKVRKYSLYIRKNIGSFLIDADKYYYFFNKYTLTNRVIKKREVEKILGLSVQEI